MVKKLTKEEIKAGERMGDIRGYKILDKPRPKKKKSWKGYY